MADEDESQSENEGEFLASEPEIPKALTKDEAADCLNCVGPTFRKIDNAFSYSSCSYAYVAMDVVGRNLTNIDVIPYFAHVMFLDLSSNRLADESLTPLAEMEQLVTLILDNNRLEKATIPTFPQLQILSLRNNRITTCRIRSQPNLEYLELGGNNIQEIRPVHWGQKVLPKLKELSLRGNGLKSSTGINFPNLVSLFLAENDITVIDGLQTLANLKFLHLRNNPIKTLDGFSEVNRKLFYLNIRECKISKASELQKLSVLPKLERIVVVDNPFAGANYRIQLIAFLPKLRRIDKAVVEKSERRKGKRLAEKMNDDGGGDEGNEDEEVEQDVEELY